MYLKSLRLRQLQQESEYERSRWHGQYLTNWAPAYGERKSIGSASCSSSVSVVLDLVRARYVLQAVHLALTAEVAPES